MHSFLRPFLIVLALALPGANGTAQHAAAVPAAVTSHDSVPAVDSQPVVRLTGDILTRMNTFWARLQQEPDSVQTLGTQISQATLKRIMFIPRRAPVSTPPPVRSTFVTLAAHEPSVAADLRAAGLTAAQWDDACTAFYRAVIVNNQLVSMLAGSLRRVNRVPPTATDTMNVHFLNAHAHEGDTLMTTLHLLDQINTVMNAELQYERNHQALNP